MIIVIPRNFSGIKAHDVLTLAEIDALVASGHTLLEVEGTLAVDSYRVYELDQGGERQKVEVA